jgi:hypothetical protein
VVVPPRFVVVVVVEGTVVLVVVVVAGEDVVVVDGTDVVEVGEVGLVVDVVVVVVEAGGDEGLTTLSTDVPVPPWPKIADRGLPAMSSMAVTNSRAITNTMAAVPAMDFQLNRLRGRPPRVPAPVLVRGPASVPSPVASPTAAGVVLACRRSVAGASATAETSRRSVVSDAAAVDSIRVVSAAA